MTKVAADAEEQATWFRHARQLVTVDGLRCVEIISSCSTSYTMEYVDGPTLADVREPLRALHHVEVLLSQVAQWERTPADNDADWATYLARLAGHVDYVGSPVARRALDVVRGFEPFPQSWCHGDLTLENVLCDRTGVVLIDPNYSRGLYQSAIMDYGKIMQSTHTAFHQLISPRTGVFGAMDLFVADFLRERDLYQPALRACLTHALRLFRHWPGREPVVEAIVSDLLVEVTS